jgi:hypothetical protein
MMVRVASRSGKPAAGEVFSVSLAHWRCEGKE